MAMETLVKRMLYVAKCPTCNDVVTKTENPPKERFCMDCNCWVPYVEESYTGPSTF